MLVLISPAKTMKDRQQFTVDATMPRLLPYSEKVVETMKKFSQQELQVKMKVNEALAALNYERYQLMNLYGTNIKALDAYDGIQYKSMDVQSLDEEQSQYLNDTVRIISAMYGYLRPSDCVCPYRLELQQKGVTIGECTNLYEFWREPVYQLLQNELAVQRTQTNIKREEQLVVNLASAEYSRLIEPYLEEAEFTYITCTFLVKKGEQVKVESTASKKARGQMVQYIARHRIATLEGLKQFDCDGYRLAEEVNASIDMRQIELRFIKDVL